MPQPLSSHTTSSGSGSRVCTAWPAALRAPTAVEWLIEASPRLATTTASSGHGVATPSRLRAVQRERQADRSRQVGGDRRGLRDHVQRRVAEHLVPAAGDRLVAARRSAPAARRAPGRRPAPAPPGRSRSRPSGSAAAPGRSAAAPSRRPRCSRGPPSRSCRSPRRLRTAAGPRGRGAGSAPGPRRARAASRSTPRRGPVRAARRRRSPGSARRGRPSRAHDAVTCRLLAG